MTALTYATAVVMVGIAAHLILTGRPARHRASGTNHVTDIRRTR